MSIITQDHIAKAIGYPEYKDLVTGLLAEGKTTGPDQSEGHIEYTKLNAQRSKRVEKTSEISQELSEVLSKTGPQIWLVLVEAWCGDVAANLPVLWKMSEVNPDIEMKLLLRDEHPEIMDAYLTDGHSRAIPKLIILDPESLEDIAVWGPRPKPAQDLVRAYKADPNPIPYQEFVITVQKWYNEDKFRAIQREFVELLSAVGAGQS